MNWQIVGRCWASFLHMNLLMRVNPDLQHPAWLMLWPLMTRNCRLLGCVALGWDFVLFFHFFPSVVGCWLHFICDLDRIWIQFSKFFVRMEILHFSLCAWTSMLAHCPLWRNFHCTEMKKKCYLETEPPIYISLNWTWQLNALPFLFLLLLS